MLPRFTPNFKLLNWINENIRKLEKDSYGLYDAASYVRVNWLLNEYGI
jgi:hypothetical protein